MQQFLVMMKQMGIFLICAQSILHFVPGEKYARYVKVIVKIMLLAQLLIPVYAITQWKEIEEIEEQLQEFAENYEIQSYEIEDSEEQIYAEAELVIQKKLQEHATEYGYQVNQVKLYRQTEETKEVLLSVSIKPTESESRNSKIHPIQIRTIQWKEAGKQAEENEQIKALQEKWCEELEIEERQLEVYVGS